MSNLLKQGSSGAGCSTEVRSDAWSQAQCTAPVLLALRPWTDLFQPLVSLSSVKRGYVFLIEFWEPS